MTAAGKTKARAGPASHSPALMQPANAPARPRGNVKV